MVRQGSLELPVIDAAKGQGRQLADGEPADIQGLQRRWRLHGPVGAAEEEQLVDVNRQGRRICWISRSQHAISFTAELWYPVSSRISRVTADEGESPGSAQPPGSDHRASVFSCISRTRCWSSKMAPRTSTFGVA